MKRITSVAVFLALLGVSLAAFGHYQMVYPSDDFISEGDSNVIEIKLIFTHPGGGVHGEGEDPTSMDMPRPQAFGVLNKGRKIDLLDTLALFKFEHGAMSADAWKTTYRCRGMGDFVFYLEPAPYYDSLEDAYLTHYAKVIVNAGGFPTDWDAEVGLPAEIVPLSRPWPLWVGNTFQGIVKMNGEPVPYAEIEVEYLYAPAFKGAFPLQETPIEIEGGVYPGQVIKANANGVFTFSFPWAGWWGFAALMEGAPIEGKDHEVGALIMVKVCEAGKVP
jgi:cobalt/nickel transport protein